MKILIIRSASMERFDALARALGVGSPTHDTVDVLTPPHSIPSLKAYYPLFRRIAYPAESGFSAREVSRLVRKKALRDDYDDVIVLVSNLSGGGHFNVLRAAHLLGDRVRIYNINGEFREVPKDAVFRQSIMRICLFPVAIFGTIFSLIVGVPVLLACMAKNSPIRRGE